MSHTDTVREFLSILNPQSEARPTILLGAGASFHPACLSRRRASNASRGVTTPSGWLRSAVPPEQVKTSEWMAWLSSQPWFIRDPARLGENFPFDGPHLGSNFFSRGRRDEFHLEKCNHYKGI